MKKDFHPKVHEVTARCACGNAFQTISTDQRIEVDICSGCHPLFTGQQKFIDTAGRIEKFQARYEKSAAAKKAATPTKKKK
jgi:large subunit ribosomal protein L31